MLDVVPIGAFVLALCGVAAVVPIRHPRSLATASWFASYFPNELPFVFLLVVVGPNVVGLLDGDLSTRDRVSVALAAVVVTALVVIVVRALRTRSVIARALVDAMGDESRTENSSAATAPLRRRRRWLRILFLPWPLRPQSVTRTANVAYGERGTEQLLDVYRHRSQPADAPTLIHLHGGGFRWGRKSREARALLFRLADQGWTCISANYHLSRTPTEGFPTHLIDVKRLVAWARTDGREHGVCPETIVLSGSSAGGQLTAMAALTANDPHFQPGFEQADTSIAAGIGLGGYYGGLDGDDASTTSPLARHGPTPPFFVIHGDGDTSAPPAGARRLADHLRSLSDAVVAYAELPGGQHAFDLFGSIRFEAVVDGIEVFTAWLRDQRLVRTSRALSGGGNARRPPGHTFPVGGEHVERGP
jgi:acetyl esterase/lipase